MEEDLIRQLQQTGASFTREDIVFITKDSTGQIVWLEIGNETAGLTHIIERHLDDFTRSLGLSKEDLPGFLKDVVSNGSVVSNMPSKGGTGFNRVYDFDGSYYTVTAIGNNGFIVTAFPNPKEG